MDDLEFDEMLKSAHNAYKTLFFTKGQMAILTTDIFPAAVFIADFGAGNQLKISPLTSSIILEFTLSKSR